MSSAKNATHASTSRAKSTRPTVWSPPSNLDAPPPKEGFQHRWLRTENMGANDAKNLSARLREGFELVRADEYPDFEAPTIENGKHAGVIGVGGLLLARIPTDIVKQRSAYYGNRANGQLEAVDNDMMRDQHSSMSIHKPERQSRVTFGGPREE
jgi:hypothetical protein|tara:strand:- start:2261 stop:2722 length:462 start_codon:yes stop_codon:yes gene_type:complete